MRTKRLKAPQYLSAGARRWFEAIANAYELFEHHLKILELAARTWDRAEEARKALKKGGLTITDRYGQVKPHPCVNVERDSQLRFARLCRELNLDTDEPEEPRLPRSGRRD